jgi:hypothetical protein
MPRKKAKKNAPIKGNTKHLGENQAFLWIRSNLGQNTN